MAGDDGIECAVVGGGAAGLSAALVLGRARRRVAVFDVGGQSNRPAAGVGGLLGHDGTPPERLYELARAQLGAYPSVELRDEEVVAARPEVGGFALTGGSGAATLARRVLLATGMRYEPPDLPGLEALWGDTVFHCPFCHAWELRDRPLAVYGRGPEAVHQALLLTGWSQDVIVLSDGPAPFDAADRARLRSAGVAIDERRVARLDAAGGALRAVVFDDDGELARAGLLVHAPLRRRSRLAEDLGVAFTAAGTIEVDEWGATGVPGLYAAGDVAAPIQQVSLAVAAGARAAVAITRELIFGEGPA